MKTSNQAAAQQILFSVSDHKIPVWTQDYVLGALCKKNIHFVVTF